MELLDIFNRKVEQAEEKNNSITEEDNSQDNLQYNSQDMDQEQNVDVKPVQANKQTVNVYVNTDNDDYSAKISGTTFVENTKQIAANVRIFLFFGYEYIYPVFKTYSDFNGNFKIEDIPPGYYTIQANFGEHLRYKSHIIKVLPRQKLDHSILLN